MIARSPSIASRRLLWRWNVRLLRLEWRQYSAIFTLIVVAVALSSAAVLATYHLVEPPENTYGTAEVIASTFGDQSIAHEALIEQGLTFGTVQIADLGLPGAAERLPVKAQDPDNTVTGPLLALIDGRWPTAPGEIAVTDQLRVDGAVLGATIDIGETSVAVVGLVENPTDLGDEFVFATDLDQFEVPLEAQETRFLIDAKPADVTFPAGSGRVTLASRQQLLSVRTAAALAVNGVAAIAMVEVALLVGAGFAVLAKRRTRQYGLLGAIGATPGQLRTAATGSGMILGLVAALVGTALGSGAVAAVVPLLETSTGHRIALTLPWWTVTPTIVMATVAASIAARWPARPLAKRPVAHLLSALRPQPAPTGPTTALGAVLSAAGAAAIILGFARLSTSIALIGIVVAPIGLLLLAPLFVELIGRGSTRLAMTPRLGGRAVARHNRRSAAVVAALAIALGIPAGVVIVTTSVDRHNATKAPNLDERSAIAWVPGAEQSIPHIPAYLVDDVPSAGSDDGVVEPIEPLRAELPGAVIVPIEVPIDPDALGFQETFDRIGSQSAVIPHFAVRAGEDCLNCDIYAFGDVDADGEEILYVQSEAWIADPSLLAALAIEPLPAGAAAVTREDGMLLASDRGVADTISDRIVFDETLPPATGIAPLLVAPETVDDLGLDRVTIGWFVVGDEPLTAEDRDRITAATNGDLFTEFRNQPEPASGVRLIAIVAGLAVSLGITVAAVGLFTAESADDVRILQSIGAEPRTARLLSASVAAFLAGAGSVLAVLIGYLALLPLLTIDDADFDMVVPWLSLGSLLLSFPVLAAGAGWLADGRHNPSLVRPR